MVAVAAVGIVSAVCAVVVRRQSPELALLLAICAGVLIVLWCSGSLKTIMAFVDKLAKIGELSSGIEAVVKVTGIAFITRLGAEFCRDAKEGTLASAVELAGTVFSLLVVIPMMYAVLELLLELL